MTNHSDLHPMDATKYKTKKKPFITCSFVYSGQLNDECNSRGWAFFLIDDKICQLFRSLSFALCVCVCLMCCRRIWYDFYYIFFIQYHHQRHSNESATVYIHTHGKWTRAFWLQLTFWIVFEFRTLKSPIFDLDLFFSLIPFIFVCDISIFF